MIIYDGALAEVTARFGRERQIHLTLSEPVDDAVARASAALDGWGGIQASQPDSARLLIAFDSRTATSGELSRDLVTALPVADIRIEEPTPEPIIPQLYEGSLTFESATG